MSIQPTTTPKRKRSRPTNDYMRGFVDGYRGIEPFNPTAVYLVGHKRGQDLAAKMQPVDILNPSFPTPKV